MENPNRQSFIYNLKLMKIFRWYPPTQSTFERLQGYVLYIIFLVLGVSLVGVEMLMRRGYDMMQAIFLCEGTFFGLKFLPMFRKGEQIKRCISYFDGVEFGPRDKTEQRILSNSVVLCQIIAKIYIISMACCQVLYLLPSLFLSGYDLPLRMWLPYSTTSSLVNYYTAYAYIWAVISYCAFTNASLDPLIGGLIFQAVSQLKILKHRIQNPENFDQYTFSATLLENYIYQKVVECIKHHTEILNFINEFDQCLSWCVFNQFLGTTALLCFLITAVLTVPLASIDGMTYIVYFFVILSQILFYCYFGTLLFEESDMLVTATYSSHWYEYTLETQKLYLTLMERSKRPTMLSAGGLLDLTLNTFTSNDSLAAAVYMTEWYKYDVKNQKALLTVMERSKRPVVVTVGKFVDLSLITFTTILRRSYSLLAVLKNYQ
ncbi:odorant receptor 33a-like [Zophobas morio]|uniref:odorant receptor 33a-like n=1 Tax=Zophobas morio TaxID=2755281 RepID=UPI003082BF15